MPLPYAGCAAHRCDLDHLAFQIYIYIGQTMSDAVRHTQHHPVQVYRPMYDVLDHPG